MSGKKTKITAIDQFVRLQGDEGLHAAMLAADRFILDSLRSGEGIPVFSLAFISRTDTEGIGVHVMFVPAVCLKEVAEVLSDYTAEINEFNKTFGGESAK